MRPQKCHFLRSSKEGVLMNRNLTQSRIERDNILNNSIALKEIYSVLDLPGVNWQDDIWFTKEFTANFYGVDVRTIENQISKNLEELTQNGYRVLTSQEIQDFRHFVTEIDFGHKTRNLAIISFKAFLNLAMLLQNSPQAKSIRSKMLDIVIDVLTEKTGGQRLFINQRDASFLRASYGNSIARKDFTQALNAYVDMGMYKYEYFTNEVYRAIFKENAKEYQKILKLKSRSNLRDTMYSEVLTNIAAIESGLAYDIETAAKKKGDKLSKDEVENLISHLTSHPSMKIYIDNSRTKMASRDACFRDAHHTRLQEYIDSVDKEDFEKFLGEKSKALEEQIDEYIEVFKRLKDK